MEREYHKWFSPSLGRDMELLVFGHGGCRVIAFPTREGRFYDYENFRFVAALQDRIERGELQLYCVDSVDGDALYGWHRSPKERAFRHLAFESYILDEVCPFTQMKNPDGWMTAHGCSFGAYHAVNIALRHPDTFQEVVAFSGRFDLTKAVGSYPDLFSGHYDEDVYYIMPNHFMPNLSDEVLLEKLRQLRVVLAIGEHDPFYESNQHLSATLHAKSISHEMHVWGGEAHRFRDWRNMARHYLANGQ